MSYSKLIYLPYILKRTDYKKLREYIAFISLKKRISKQLVVKDMLRCFFKYDTSFLDYFYLGFYERRDSEISTYASTWYMYNFQRRMNDPARVPYFQDKAKFYQKFAAYVRHSHFLPQGKIGGDLIAWLNTYKPEKIMAKNSQGQVGSGIEKFSVAHQDGRWKVGNRDVDKFLAYAKANHLNLIETFIQQHDFLQHIAPSALSTIRIITIIDKSGSVDIIGSILRMSAGKDVDNYDAGGVSAAIDTNTGIITGKVHFKDPKNNEVSDLHPLSGNQVTGLAIPYWNEIINMVKSAALVVPQIKTVGWDVVLTNQGPSLLEGNHNWDKTHWQKSYGGGKKAVLDAYL